MAKVMMPVNTSYATSEELSQSLESARLELEYERVLREAERIYEDERARTLRVQLLLLEDEAEEMQETLQINEEDLQKCEDNNLELRDQLAHLDDQYQLAQTELKACIRDIDVYQAEINALNATSTDSKKLLSEKLALTRELATLKPELEHLKSYTANQQHILGEKLALERELNAVQVELETEKRTIQRIKNQSNSGDASLNEEIEELKKELAKERRNAQKLEREHKAKKVNEKASADAALADELEELRQELAAEKKKVQRAERETVKKSSEESTSAETLEQLKNDLAKERKNVQRLEHEALKKSTQWDSQKEGLETKLDAFRNKLRSTKEQLKEAQEELERREAAKFAESTAATKARMTGTTTNPKKRNVARFDPDMTIGTPGHGGPASKKQRTIPTVGDKSSFSITPFLNRTMSILPESPSESVHDKVNETLRTQINALAAEAEDASAEPGVTKNTSTIAKKISVAENKGKQPLKESTNPKANAIVKKAVLPKVVEESNEESHESSENPTQALDVEAKKKKHLGGNTRKNIFDEDEDVDVENDKTVIGKKKTIGLRGGGGLGKVTLGKNKAPKLLAEFSPLKKDRRPNTSIFA